MFEIDVLLAPLMPLLWGLGIETLQSCQEKRQGYSSITFSDTGALEAFLNVGQRHYHFELETWDEGDNGELALRINLNVYFPIGDIPDLVSKFTAEQR